MKGLFVVAVKRFEGGLKLRRKAQGVQFLRLASALFRHLRADVLPEIPEHRHLRAGNVVGDRHARQLDDAALDGVHEGEVAHGPWEEGAFGIAGAAKEEGRGGEVDHAGEPELAVDGFKA